MIDARPLDIVPADPTLRLRPAMAADLDFHRRLFADVRRGQFEATGIAGPILDQIIAQQFRSQTVGYAAQFPDAAALIMLRDLTPVGRLLLHCLSDPWHVIDIALLPAECGAGLGSGIFDALEASARSRGIAALTLTVPGSNRAAHRFYVRRGFVEIGSADGPHIAMKKTLAI